MEQFWELYSGMVSSGDVEGLTIEELTEYLNPGESEYFSEYNFDSYMQTYSFSVVLGFGLSMVVGVASLAIKIVIAILKEGGK